MKYLSLPFAFFFLSFNLSVSAQVGHLHFIENNGQIIDQYGGCRPDIEMSLKADGLNMFIGKGVVHYQFWRRAQKNAHGQSAMSSTKVPDIGHYQAGETSSIETYRMDVELVGANPAATIVKEKELPYYETYYLPHCGEGGIVAHAFERAIYRDIYPHIDWVIYTKVGGLEYEFVVREGGDPADIQVRYNGATCLDINADGSLTASTPFGEVSESAPLTYGVDGRKIASSYVLDGNTLRFHTSGYRYAMLIDPTLTWGTYYNDTMAVTWGTDVATHGQTEVYMCGNTNAPDIIATTGAFQNSFGGGSADGYLVKFDSAGTRLWATYYGDVAADHAWALSCDHSGNIYMAGSTWGGNAFATLGCHQPVRDSVDAYLVKFNSAGQRIWGTYYGGANIEGATSVSVDIGNNVYLTGSTTSPGGIATPGVYEENIPGSSSDFLVKFDSNGVRLWGTYYLGTGFYNETTCDSLGNVYMAGVTLMNNSIASFNCHQPVFGGGYDDAYLAKFNSNGQRIWSTYYGGENLESASGLACDPFGNVYLAGYTGAEYQGTASTINIASTGSYQPQPAGASDQFLAKFDSAGVRLWGTYIGGPGDDWGEHHTLQIDEWYNIYLSGSTNSTSGTATTGAWQQTYGGGSYDNYVVKFDSSCNLLWGSYYGGENNERYQPIAYSGGGKLQIVTTTLSSVNMATTGSFQPAYLGGNSAVLGRINDCVIPVLSTGISGNNQVCASDTIIYTVPMVNGATYYTWSLPGGWSGSSNSHTINVITGTNGGIVTLTASSNCGSSNTQTLNVIVHPSPQPVINVAGNTLTTGVFVTYQWYLNGNIISSATSQSYAFSQQGNYTVKVTDVNGCSGYSSYPVSANALSSNALVNIYPNPANDKLVVSILKPGMENLYLELYNAVGQKVSTYKVIPGAALDISIIPSGVYTYKLLSGADQVAVGVLNVLRQ